VELVAQRLKLAQQDYEHGMAIKKSTKQLVMRSSGNVFADLRLTQRGRKTNQGAVGGGLNQIIEDQHLSQGTAARRLKINQPKISALSHYRLEGFSVERLMNFLTALDRDVDIGHPPQAEIRKDGPHSDNSRVASRGRAGWEDRFTFPSARIQLYWLPGRGN